MNPANNATLGDLNPEIKGYHLTVITVSINTHIAIHLRKLETLLTNAFLLEGDSATTE
jgi:hypothetical protein